MNANQKHSLWLTTSRKKLRTLVVNTPNRDNKFYWHGVDYGGNSIGCVFDYKNGQDLTASVLEWWFDHEAGEVPPFDLGQIKKVMGDLFDENLMEEIWNELATRTSR